MARKFTTIKIYDDTIPLLDTLAIVEGVSRAELIERLANEALHAPLSDPEMIALAEQVGQRAEARLRDKLAQIKRTDDRAT